MHGSVAKSWTVDTCDGFVRAQTLAVAAGLGALSVQCADEDLTYVIDVATGEVTYTLPRHRAQALAISPDGTRFVRQEGDPPDGTDGGFWHGPPRVRELASGELVTEFEDVCTWDAERADGQLDCREFPEAPFALWTWAMAWSPDSTLVAVGDQGVGAAVWDAESGARVGGVEACGYLAQGLMFSPDNDELFVFCADEGRLAVVSTATWQELRSAELDPQLEGRNYVALAGLTPDEQWLVGVGGALFVGGVAMLHWIDPETLEVDQTLPRIHEGTTKSWAMSPDRSLLATGSSDGFVKVWDVTERRQVHEIRVGDTQVQGVAFVDDDHLAVAPEEGGVSVYTLAPDELLSIVRASLTRGFTTTECARFNFGADCPTLADMRG